MRQRNLCDVVKNAEQFVQYGHLQTCLHALLDRICNPVPIFAMFKATETLAQRQRRHDIKRQELDLRADVERARVISRAGTMDATEPSVDVEIDNMFGAVDPLATILHGR